jgi:lysophospholipase L1-like esterase
MITNYALLTGTCLAALLLAEGGLRIAAYYRIHLFDRLKHPSEKPKPGEEVTLGRLIRLNSNPRILYDLIPDISVIFRSQPVSINSNGFRGNPIPLEKGKGSIRILGLGDSVMFGWGVKDHETYLAHLAFLLNTTSPQYSWDVVNTAVPGYNTIMEVETLKEKGLQYTPDLVIIEYVRNDLNLPNFIQGWENPFSLKKLFFKQFIARLTQSAETPDKLIEVPLDIIEEQVEETPQQVPEQYRDMVGKDAFYHAMQELHGLSQKYDFDVVVLSLGFPQFVADICQQFHFEMIAIYPAWQEYVATHEIADEQAAWKLTPEDPHPSILGHRVIAEAIFEQFRAWGMIQKLQGKRNSS